MNMSPTSIAEAAAGIVTGAECVDGGVAQV